MLSYYHKLPGGQNTPPVEWELHGGDIGDGEVMTDWSEEGLTVEVTTWLEEGLMETGTWSKERLTVETEIVVLGTDGRVGEPVKLACTSGREGTVQGGVIGTVYMYPKI